MKLKYCAIIFSATFGVAGLVSAQTVFDANGRRLNAPQEPSTQYQWTDPKTGKVITREYPPANLQMRQVERRGDLVILEVIGAHKFSDAINLATPKSVEEKEKSGGSALDNCVTKIRDKYSWKDPDSVRVDSEPSKTMTTATGEVRQALIIKINAKNSYGAYAGAKTYRCIIGADNSTPISINEW